MRRAHSRCNTGGWAACGSDYMLIPETYCRGSANTQMVVEDLQDLARSAYIHLLLHQSARYGIVVVEFLNSIVYEEVAVAPGIIDHDLGAYQSR